MTDSGDHRGESPRFDGTVVGETAHRHGATFVVANPEGIARRTPEITGLLQILTTAGRLE